MDEQKIIFSNRFEKEKFEDYKTDLGTDSSVTPDFTEADDFLKFILPYQAGSPPVLLFHGQYIFRKATLSSHKFRFQFLQDFR